MRLFVAIFPPPEVREALSQAVKILPVKGDVRWVPARNVHLTLKFLGDVPEEKVDEIGSVLEEISAGYGPFEVEPSGFGAFPSERKARVVWSGVGEGAETLRSIAEELEPRLEALGFEREKRGYTPHITLGRARKRPAKLEAADADGATRVPGFTARRLELVESALGGKGASYSTVIGYPLTGRRRREGLSP